MVVPPIFSVRGKVDIIAREGERIETRVDNAHLGPQRRQGVRAVKRDRQVECERAGGEGTVSCIIRKVGGGQVGREQAVAQPCGRFVH